ncbi:hypothetical protein GCM10020331_065500 [Ectobacillus funiculus]
MGNSLGMENESIGNITVYNNRPSLLFKINYRKKANLGRPKATFYKSICRGIPTMES